MKSRRPVPAPSTSPRTSPARGLARPGPGNAALADGLVAQAQAGKGQEVAMGRGHAAGMIAGFGMAAANALSSGGLPAMLNPNGYWDTMAEPARTELIRPAGASRLKPAD